MLLRQYGTFTFRFNKSYKSADEMYANAVKR